MAEWRLTRVAQKQLLLTGTRPIAGAVDGPFSACSIALAKAIISYDPDMVIADVTEADYDGYARQAVTWAAAPHNGSDGRPSIAVTTLLDFIPTGSSNPQTVLGAVLLKTAGSAIQAVRNFDSGIPMEDASSLCRLVEELSMSLDWLFGKGIVLS